MDPHFITAYNHIMLYEVGPWFDPNDPDTIAGNIGTPQLNRKCGYVDIDGDSGGCTKYGIAQKDNPSLDVSALNLAGAQQVYLSSYWIPGKSDQISSEAVTAFYFDMCVNNGLGRGAKILQQAAGVTVDGSIGPETLTVVNAADPSALINSMSTLRAARYNLIVQNDPSQAKFLDGWLRRNSEVTTFALGLISGS